MKTGIEIIIPVTVKFEMAYNLLSNLANNTILPDRVIIIDNSIGKSYFIPNSNYPFKLSIYADGFRKSCNASWNLGITKLSKRCKYVTILNDDISISPWFLERVLKVFKNFQKAGVSCPETILDKDGSKSALLLNNYLCPLNVIKMRHREGGAFTILKSILDNTPPIPNELCTFYGDDWFWRWTYKLGYIWMKDTTNRIYHLGGVTNKAIGINKDTYIKEKQLWGPIADKAGISKKKLKQKVN